MCGAVQQGSLYTVRPYTTALGLTPTTQPTLNMQTPSKQFRGSKWESQMEVCTHTDSQRNDLLLSIFVLFSSTNNIHLLKKEKNVETRIKSKQANA